MLRARLIEEARTALAPRPGFRFAPGRLAAWGSLAVGAARPRRPRWPSWSASVALGRAGGGRLQREPPQRSTPSQAITLSFNSR